MFLVQVGTIEAGVHRDRNSKQITRSPRLQLYKT